jgi:LCP family protein required for cell wall assembly
MAPGDDERPDRPEYNVYRAGRGRGRGRRESSPAREVKGPERSSEGAGRPGSAGDEPGYRVYRSKRNPLAKLRGADIGSVRDKLRRDSGSGGAPREPGEKPTWRKVLRWVLIAAAAWFLLSVVLFAISAEIQKSKLNGDAEDLLGGNPFLVASPQTILVIGTDARPEGTDEAGAETDPECLEAAAEGDPAPSSCIPSRADTLMLVRAGGGAFEKLSIPRDVYADIPGQGAQKINGAYAFGGAALQIETVENFLGIDVDHVVILDFEGFADFIDSIGGITVNLPNRVKSLISGGSSNGGITLKLDRGENDLDGQQALALARTRTNLWDPSEDDTDRARRQQLIIAGIKDQLTSPVNIPINFIRGPWIGWNAPKAMVTDMGALTLPQLGIAAAIGGDSGTKILKPTGPGPGGSLLVPPENCEKAVKNFLGEAGPQTPQCSPG